MEAGREGGTWLGISTNTQQKAIKLGALLNVTGEKQNPNAKGDKKKFFSLAYSLSF
jgi:hypothetical protein